ncbi:MAG: serine/threonine-protein kinase [Acidimicrobiales bacterium]
MSEMVWVPARTLTLPYGTLATLHVGQSEVHLRRNILSQEMRVFKSVSLLGREDTLAFNEVVLLQGIDHANVAKVFDVVEPAGADPVLKMAEIVMPYYAEGSLLDVMNKGRRFSAGEARDITVKCLRGLGHLHDQHRILHRDLKPANIFLAGDETLVKVGDFGEAVRMTAGGTADPLLSPQPWTPPESFTGGRYTVSSDVYAMGLTFAELLSGPFPYDDYTRERLAERLSKGRPAVRRRDLTFQAHVPSALRRVVTKATRVEPAGRYQSADGMVRALLRARFVDWDWPTVGEREVEWSGTCNGTRFRVVSRRVRGKGWRAWPERKYAGGWRRPQGSYNCEAANPLDAASAAFSQIDKHLSSA